MAGDGRRTEKVARLLKAEVSELLIREVKDPEVAGVTITDVRLSADLSVARVYFAAAEGRAQSAAEGLARVTPFLRRELGRRLHLRRVPELRFLSDEALEHGLRVESILKEISEGEEP